MLTMNNRCIAISEIEIAVSKIIANITIWKPFWHSVAPSGDVEKHAKLQYCDLPARNNFNIAICSTKIIIIMLFTHS